MDSKSISKIYLASKSPRRRELLAKSGEQLNLLRNLLDQVAVDYAD